MNLIVKFYQKFLICKKIQDLNHFKVRGDSPVDVLMILLVLPFIHFGTISGLLNSAYGNHFISQKDVYYRFKNNSKINWRSLLYSINKRYTKLVKEEKKKSGTTKEPTENFTCLIGDDTLFRKYGIAIEKVSMVFDHVSKRPVLGFKALVLGIHDGISFRPLDFSLHREKGKNKKKPYGLSRKELKKQYKADRDVSSPSVKRIKEVDASKIDILINMVKRAAKNGFIPDFLLTDSWFLCDKLITSIRKIKNGAIHIVAAGKMDNRKYLYNSKEYTAKELLRKFINTAKRSRKLSYKYVMIEADYKGTTLYLYFNKAFGHKKWHLLITTKSRLSFNQLMNIYSRRWTIEVFFKEVKGHLLGGKCQSNNFDAQLCDFTISCINFTILSLCKRFSSYETIGGVFEGTSAFLIEQTVAERIWDIFLEIIKVLLDFIEVDIFDLMQQALSDNEKGEKILKILNVLRCYSEKDDIFNKKIDNAA